MPTAPDYLRHKWLDKEGYPSETKAMAFLEGRGWFLRPDWCWNPPSPHHQVTEEEQSAIDFLILEWDFGGVQPYRDPAAFHAA